MELVSKRNYGVSFSIYGLIFSVTDSSKMNVFYSRLYSSVTEIYLGNIKYVRRFLIIIENKVKMKILMTKNI